MTSVHIVPTNKLSIIIILPSPSGHRWVFLWPHPIRHWSSSMFLGASSNLAKQCRAPARTLRAHLQLAPEKPSPTTPTSSELLAKSCNAFSIYSALHCLRTATNLPQIFLVVDLSFSRCRSFSNLHNTTFVQSPIWVGTVPDLVGCCHWHCSRCQRRPSFTPVTINHPLSSSFQSSKQISSPLPLFDCSSHCLTGPNQSPNTNSDNTSPILWYSIGSIPDGCTLFSPPSLASKVFEVKSIVLHRVEASWRHIFDLWGQILKLKFNPKTGNF